jgi:hypothetical protein
MIPEASTTLLVPTTFICFFIKYSNYRFGTGLRQFAVYLIRIRINAVSQCEAETFFSFEAHGSEKVDGHAHTFLTEFASTPPPPGDKSNSHLKFFCFIVNICIKSFQKILKKENSQLDVTVISLILQSIPQIINDVKMTDSFQSTQPFYSANYTVQLLNLIMAISPQIQFHQNDTAETLGLLWVTPALFSNFHFCVALHNVYKSCFTFRGNGFSLQ